jgi:ABC-type multidrug transport system fused ATPase/permease subunit
MKSHHEPTKLKSVNKILLILAKKCGFQWFILSAGLLFSTQMFLILIPRFIGNYIDNPKSSSVLFILVLFIVSAILSFLARIVVSEIQQKSRRFSKLYIYDEVLANGRTDQNLDPGRLESFVSTISFSVRAMFADSLTLLITVISMLIIVTVFLGKISLLMSCCYIVTSILFIPLSYYFAKRNSKNINDCVTLTANVSQTMIDVLSKLIVVRAFRAKNHEVKIMDDLLLAEEIKYKDIQSLTEKNTFIQNIFLSVFNSCLIFYAIILLNKGTLHAV